MILIVPFWGSAVQIRVMQPGPSASAAASPRADQPAQKFSASSIQVLQLDPGDVVLPPEFRMAVYEDLIAQLTKTGLFQHVYRNGDGKDYATIEGYTCQCVGGGTQHYGGVSLRYSALDFALKSLNEGRTDLQADFTDDVKRELRDWPRARLRRWLRTKLARSDDLGERHPPSSAEIERALRVIDGEVVAIELEGGRRLSRRAQRLALEGDSTTLT